jgi:hypothetical protein
MVRLSCCLNAALGLVLFLAPAVPAAELKLLLPLGRTAYQTNEWIDVSVVRSSDEARKESGLKLTLTGKNGGAVSVTFDVPAVPLAGRQARATEHLHVNARLLRPGHYTVEVSCDGVQEKTGIDVFSHLRQSSFRLINWGRASKPGEQLPQGEDSFGFNTFYGHYANDDNADFIRAGVDFIANCVMSGGHQMDLRLECDWSDPFVIRGGAMRAVRRAFIDRTRPNVPGIHFYDEPGLTWHKHPRTGEFTPHEIPAQMKSYRAAFERDPPPYDKLDPRNLESARHWRHWAKWKLSLMNAAWKEAQYGVSSVRPDLLSLTQSQYGWSAFTDGYYFNVTRSLPVTSGHGGYHDYGPGYFNPSYTLEMARARTFDKPCWYAPTWYANTTNDQFRLEQNLAFMTNLQGIMSPPDLEPATNLGGRQGVVECNQLMRRLGPIFTTLPVTRPPVAMLYSLSQVIHAQTKDKSATYAHGSKHGANLPLVYLAGKLLQHQFLTVLDEDIIDGTLADNHKAVVLTSIDYLDPKVIGSLERFIEDGGVVLLTGDCSVKVKGSVKLKVKPAMPDQEELDRLAKKGNWAGMGPYTTTAKHIEGATPLAKAIKTELAKAKIQPIFECDAPGICATRQASGDIEYFFAVNAGGDPDKKKERLALGVTAATITLPPGPGRIYDAARGGPVPEFRKPTEPEPGRSGRFRFGPGQMRVFARTARPLGGVRLATPLLSSKLSDERSPLTLDVSATLVDDKGRTLAGSAPLLVQVIDPLGATRHQVYRATRQGTFQATLPLAANDPSGRWKVVVRELLNNGEDSAAFTFKAPSRAGAIAGATRRAVSFGNDRDNIFRFARNHRSVTLVKGSSASNAAAAKRLTAILKPWGVECKEMPLGDASKPRKLTAEEARTWCGLAYAGSGQVKVGASNSPAVAGFAVEGPVILIGTPEDNPLIKFLLTERFLPYTPTRDGFPGVGRGLVAWQRDGVGRGQESVTLIAYDEAGMKEAVGAVYQAVAGQEPLTRWKLPTATASTPAKSAPGLLPSAALAWQVSLPDRVVALKPMADGLHALTHDGSLSVITRDGKRSSSRVLPADQFARALKDLAAPRTDTALGKLQRRNRILKLASSSGGKTAAAYWGGTLRIIDDKVLTEQQMPQDVTALAWLGGKVVAGLADGRVIALVVGK